MTVKKRRPGVHLPGSARSAALAALLDVEQGRLLDEAVEGRAARLDKRDRALANTLAYGVTRHRGRLDHILDRFLTRPDRKLDPAVRSVLRLGLFQILHLDRIPNSAAVNESVNLARGHGPPWSPKLVNAVLRNIIRADRLPDPMDAGLSVAEAWAAAYSHPVWMVGRLLADLGPEETESLLRANNDQPPLALRTNTRRITREALLESLAGRDARPAPYSPEGVLVWGPTGPVNEIQGYEAGFFAVQDEASQMVGLLAAPRAGERILDACAGRGGKSLHLSLLSGGEVWALDVDRGRLSRIPGEAARLGAGPIRIAAGSLLNPPFSDHERFHLVLVDAPCSNLGVIRRRPDVKWLKREGDIKRLADIQLDLLSAAAPRVVVGGRLVYAVCTNTPEETTGVLDRFLASRTEFRIRPAGRSLPPTAQAMVTPRGALRAWPHRHGTDGFFAVALERV